MSEQISSREWCAPRPDSLEPPIALGFVEDIGVWMTGYNTHLVRYRVGDGKFDHVVHRLSGTMRITIQLDEPTFSETKQELLARGFPVYYEYEPDEDILAWHAGLQDMPEPGEAA